MKTIENYSNVQFLSLAIIVEFPHFYTNPTTTTILHILKALQFLHVSTSVSQTYVVSSEVTPDPMTLSSSGGKNEFQSAKASAAPLLLLHGAGFYPSS